jgi:VanZ family protein
MTFKKFAIYHLPAILYGIGIIFISSIPNLSTPKIKFVEFDKVLHFIEYALFSFLVYRSFSYIFKKLNPNWILFFSFFFLAFFALVDEWHQKYIPGRYSDPYDLTFDIIGSILILVLFWLHHKRVAGA